MTNITARPLWKSDIFWWIVLAALLSFGLAGCQNNPVGTDAVPESEQNEPAATDSTNPTDDQVNPAAGDGTGTTTPTATAASPEALQLMAADVTSELEDFKRGEVDELDAPVIEQIEDSGLLTADVAKAWTEGFSYEVGDPVDDGDGTASVPVTLTVKQIGPLVAEGTTPDQLATALNGADLMNLDVSVDFYAEPDGDWEMSPSGEQTLADALVGDLAWS